MKKILLSALVYLCAFVSYGQVVINELDPDTPSTDVKEFIELKTPNSNTSLTGYVLVFYNGGSNTSYYAIDLDGLVTDSNGNMLLGNLQVSPAPTVIIPQNTIQNGPDAVAIYLGNDTDFPTGTTVTAANLIDAFAYSNAATTQPTTCMTVLGIAVSYNENVNGMASSESYQRKTDGTFEVKTPTPGANNDGSGNIFNGITTTFSPMEPLYEGQNMTVTFTTTTAVTSTLSFTITLNNGSFTNADFSGNRTIIIPTGSRSVTVVYQILNDGVNEGDENLKISIGTVPSNYILTNNNIFVRVNDINFTVSNWGTPLNPTHGQVLSTAPIDYYSSLEGLSGSNLKQALQNIIANPAVVHSQNYGDVSDILKIADQNPANSNQIWMMYVEQPRSKIDLQSGNSIIGFWNKEHIFPQSRGGFANATSSIPDGINVWTTTNADDIAAGHADAHHIRAEDGSENSSRSNRDYGTDYNGPAGSQGSWHGDVARSLFYMAVRYNALSLVNGNPPDTTLSQMGDLATLLSWNHADPSDDYEMHRNNYIYTWQVNRNPFIDYPNLADYIWGSNAGQQWFSSLATTAFSVATVTIYPNPSKDYIIVSGITSQSDIEIYNLSGTKIVTATINGETRLNLNLAAGVYLAKIISDSKTVIKKIIIQ